MDATSTPLETWTVAVTADTSQVQKQLDALTVSGKQFSSALSTAFDGLVVKGRSLDDVFSGLVLNLSKMALQSAFKPLEQTLGNAFSSALSGGSSSLLSGSTGTSIPTPFADGGSKARSPFR